MCTFIILTFLNNNDYLLFVETDYSEKLMAVA